MNPELLTFKQREKYGELFEKKAVIPLEKIFNAKFINNCKDYRYDLLFRTLDKREIKFEIKRDCKYNATGNIFVQFSTCDDIDNGISTTEADFYCFFLSDKAFSLIETNELKKAIDELKPLIKTTAKEKGYIVHYETLKNNYNVREFNINDF